MENFNSNAFVSDWTVICFRYLPVVAFPLSMHH
jgi:hypothetical protein